MCRLLILSYFVIISFTYSIAQDNNIESQPIDSILSWMQENYTKDSNDFHQIGLRTIAKSQRGGDLILMGNLHEALASWHGYHGLTIQDSLLYHDYKSLDYFQKANDQTSVARIYASLSIDLLNAGDLEKSQEATFNAIEIYEKLGDEDGLANCHRSLTYLFNDLGDFQKSIDYGQKAYDYYKKVKDYDRICLLYTSPSPRD